MFCEQISQRVCLSLSLHHSLLSSTLLLIFSVHHSFCLPANLSSRKIFTLSIFITIFFLLRVSVCVYTLRCLLVHFEKRTFYFLCSKLISISQRNKTCIRCLVFLCCQFVCYVFCVMNVFYVFFFLHFLSSGKS